jgi:3-oxoacyl-[acyl-carrier protein] reductase
MTAMDASRPFDGARVVITGAGGIFGRRIAATFARAGARLCLSDPRPDVLDRLPAELDLPRDATLRYATELREAASIQELVRLVAGAWRALDILVNNAGVYPRSHLLDVLDDEWDWIIDVNLRAPFLLSREMARLMIAAGVQGSVVNITSGAAQRVRAGSVSYSVSKAALERLTAGLALELAPHRIRVDARCPRVRAGERREPAAAGIPRGHAGAHPARPRVRAGRRPERHPVPLLAPGVVHHGRDARRGRREQPGDGRPDRGRGGRRTGVLVVGPVS